MERNNDNQNSNIYGEYFNEEEEIGLNSDHQNLNNFQREANFNQHNQNNYLGQNIRQNSLPNNMSSNLQFNNRSNINDNYNQNVQPKKRIITRNFGINTYSNKENIYPISQGRCLGNNIYNACDIVPRSATMSKYSFNQNNNYDALHNQEQDQMQADQNLFEEKDR